VADVLSTGPDRPPGWSPPRWLRVAGVVLVGAAAVVAGRGRLGSPPPARSAPVPPPAFGEVTEPTPVCTPAPAVDPSPPGRRLIAALAIGPIEPASATESRDRTVAAAPWTVVVRRSDGSLGRHGAVVTYPVPAPASGRGVRAAGVVGRSEPGLLTWPLAGGYAEVRGDLTEPALAAIAAGTSVRGCVPELRPPPGYAVVATGPYRSPSVREIRYDPTTLGPAGRQLGGLVYTGVTSGGGFEDQIYRHGSRPAGTVGGRPAVLSQVYGGSATLAWEPAPGVVVFVGYSGNPPEAGTSAALRALAGRAHQVSPAEWAAARPQVIDQANPP
jgi:hypothetical protein